MIYLFYGNDSKKLLNYVRGFYDAIKQKREYAQFFTYNIDNFNQNEIENIISNQGLFFDKHVLSFRNLINDKKTKEYLEKNIENFLNSDNLFLFIEDELNEKKIKLFENVNKNNIKLFEKKFIKTEIDSNYVFNLSNEIFISKKNNLSNKLIIWRKFDKLKRYDDIPEKFFAILWWTFKNKNSDKKYLKELLLIYHNAHMGEVDFWHELEHFAII